ncbi:AAA family ATPase [Candidatus Woesearchaeota archaeon]|nr:AAA family ATPase [Candidatus Woesearchaeota archaeon]
MAYKVKIAEKANPAEKVNRADLAKTGIAGLDTILKGGIRKGSSVLVTGPPGCGKTILAIQFIVEGAKQSEAGVYITSEENIEDIRSYAEALGLDLKGLEKKGLITLVRQELSPKKLMSIATPLKLIKDRHIQRVVLDSLTIFEYAYYPEEVNYRREVFAFIGEMENAGVTLLSIAEKSVPNLDEILYQPVDFLFDGLIIMAKIRNETSFEHVIMVSKMRGQDHELNIFPFIIKRGGIEVYPDQLPFNLFGKGK